MTAGLTPSGFTPKTVQEIVAEMAAAQRASPALGEDIDTSEESVLGQINAIVATQIGRAWEQSGVVYRARVPSSATFQALDDLAAITGTTRKAATAGTVTLTVTLTAGTTLPAGSVAAVSGDSANRWQTTESITNGTGSTGTFSVNAESTRTGPIAANAGTITVIVTPVSGWTAVTNASDAAVGTDVEKDTALRLRRETELSRPGTSPLDAIRADLLELADVVACTVDENTTSRTDALGRLPHSVEAVVQFTPGLSGDDLAAARQAAADQLFASKAGGIATSGGHSATVTDSLGGTHTVRWTEPEDVDVWMTVVLRVDATAWPGAAAARTAMAAWGDALGLGAAVVYSRVIAQWFAVAGVTEVVSLALGSSESSQGPNNIPIGARQRSAWDTARIAVVLA